MINGFSLPPNRLARSMCRFHTHWILTTFLLLEPCVILMVPVILWLWIRLHFGKLSHECVHMVKTKRGQISTYTKLHAKLGKVEWGRWNRFMAAFQLWFCTSVPIISHSIIICSLKYFKMLAIRGVLVMGTQRCLSICKGIGKIASNIKIQLKRQAHLYGKWAWVTKIRVMIELNTKV